jgi:4,5-dihydroxyphthalate decarboxylase
MRLRTLLGDHPCTAALKNGSIKSGLVAFDFVDYSPTNKGFKPMVREGAFDVSEMAIVTYLMAKSVGKPMVLLPDVVLARFQHSYALYNSKHGKLTPADLKRQTRGHPLLHHHHRSVAARHSRQRSWRRPRFNRLADV